MIATTTTANRNDYIQTHTVYIYSANYSFFFNCGDIKPYFNDQLRFFVFEKSKFNSNEKPLINIVEQLIFSIENYFIKKLKFAGKSFRIERRVYKTYKSINKSVYNYKFGHSYQTWLSLKNLKQKHLKKTKFFFLTTNLKKVNKSISQILMLRVWNMYTQRGIRLYKQRIIKKPGKKSSFT